MIGRGYGTLPVWSWSSSAVNAGFEGKDCATKVLRANMAPEPNAGFDYRY